MCRVLHKCLFEIVGTNWHAILSYQLIRFICHCVYFFYIILVEIQRGNCLHRILGWILFEIRRELPPQNFGADSF
jgi:hypothetical protein